MKNPAKRKPNRFKRTIIDLTSKPKMDDGDHGIITMSFDQLFDLIMKATSSDFGDNQDENDEDFTNANPEFKKSFKAYFDDLLSRKGNKSDE